MKKYERIVNKNYLQKCKTIINTSGLGLFLIAGFSGCEDKMNNECKDLGLLPQYKINECQKKQSSGGGYVGSSSHSSWFVPTVIGSSTNSNFVDTNKTSNVNTNTTSKPSFFSGFFSPSSNGTHSTSTGHSGGSSFGG